MPIARVSTDLEIHYLIDDFTDPWRKAETVLLLHGNAESGAAWFGWVPHLARHFRVVRPDMRGFGDSTPMPREYPWLLDMVVDDYAALMRIIGIQNLHVVAAKVSGIIGRRLAVRYPECVRSLTLVGTRLPRDLRNTAVVSSWIDEFEKQGIEPWACRTMPGRLGSRFPSDGLTWWAKLMSRTPVSTQVGFLTGASRWDASSDLSRIACPTLVITAGDSAGGTIEETRAWQEEIKCSRMVVLPGDSFHPAASDPDRCARETLDFIKWVDRDTAARAAGP